MPAKRSGHSKPFGTDEAIFTDSNTDPYGLGLTEGSELLGLDGDYMPALLSSMLIGAEDFEAVASSAKSQIDKLHSDVCEYGCFTVGSSGMVGFDYLLDGGGYQGELGIFSLNGLEERDVDTPAFFKEAARRVLSNSTEGNIVISDRTEDALFDTMLSVEGDSDFGDYSGARVNQVHLASAGKSVEV